MTTSPGWPVSDGLVLVVDNHDLDGEQRLSDRARLRRAIEVVEARDRRRLRQAVAFDDANAERLLEVGHQLDRHRRAARYGQPQRRGDSRDIDILLSRMLQQRPVHRRHTDPMRDALGGQAAQQRRWIEARQQHERPAQMQVGEHLRRLRGRVKERQGDGRHVAAALVGRSCAEFCRHHSVDDHVQMRQLGALRLPRRARRIKNDGRIIRSRVTRLERRLTARR